MQQQLPRLHSPSFQRVVRHFEAQSEKARALQQVNAKPLAVINVYKRGLEHHTHKPFVQPLWSFSSPF